jgi:hypothetical protein
VALPVDPETLLGETRSVVRDALGDPDRATLTYATDPDLHAFGPRPTRIAPFTPIEEWAYERHGQVHLLWFAAEEKRPIRKWMFDAGFRTLGWKDEPVLRQATAFPRGAVF